MMRFCPNCRTERSLDEIFCDGTLDDVTCGWPLTAIPIRQTGWRPTETALTQPSPLPMQCSNGHIVEAGDLICAVCGVDVPLESVSAPIPAVPGTQLPSDPDGSASPTIAESANLATGETTVAGWRLLRRIPSSSLVRERFETVRDEDGRQALLTLYSNGSEPDPEVYEVLRTLDRDHVPEILETGRWNDRAYEVSEDLRGGSLAELEHAVDGTPKLSRVLSEMGGALAALAECGIRHRDLRPGIIMVRTHEPLDLVITGFGSARLSEHDLDVVSPLEITRYTAPEAVAGGVAAASDWWSLGMLLLEQVTRGSCFAGADDQTFLISVLTNGAPIPDDLSPEVTTLLRGLLSLDRRRRWGWSEVQRWLAGDIPEAAPSVRLSGEVEGRSSIQLGGKRYLSPQRFALAAAETQHWEDARAVLGRGELATWLEESGCRPEIRTKVREIAELDGISEDIRLALTLKALNPSMPLVVRGEIITPGWLLDHPDEGYNLVIGPVPERLEAEDAERWLARLKRRETRVRNRARQLDVELEESQLKLMTLSTSRSRLAAVWDERRRILPDTDHPGLLAILERRITEEEDFILLMSAAVSQFRTADAIVDEAAQVAQRAGVQSFDREAALKRTVRSRRELNTDVETRLEGFARCGHERVDEWGDQFRLERRLPLAKTLALLAVPETDWQQPARQSYVATLLDFYARRITGSIMRGPLTRMIIGKTTARIDVLELDTPRVAASTLLNHVLLRNDQPIDIDPAALMSDPRVERRVRTLHAHATLYRRDTGIDGLYLGFPFLVMQEPKATTRPRIAPVLLWPVRLRPEVGSRGRVTLSFDRDREEVRLNPAFETLLGVETARRWQDVANELLGRASITFVEVVEAFGKFASIESTAISTLPSKDLRLRVGDDRVVCAAALFHLGFLGQAVMEDLRQLKGRPPAGTSLEAAFRVGEVVARAAPIRVSERDRYFTTDSDPSQEAAVLEARAGNGLLVEGPPGTGKSQTIVNMVADAIGTGRSLLVVCQKQAALEVVHKRLEAAGLGERIVMVTDVNKDRERIIRAIREQLEQLFQQPRGVSGWRQQREQTAARIETLERDLDEQHRALHESDDQTGLSYRLILGDLIGLSRQGQTPSVPTLRKLFEKLDPGQVATLQESCAPVARLWLPARYENSPLADTGAFSTDPGSLENFGAALESFTHSERERLEALENTPKAREIAAPESYSQWSNESAPIFLELEQPERHRLARWLDRFRGASTRPAKTTEIQINLVEIEETLRALPLNKAPSIASDVVREMTDEELLSWTEVADRLERPPSLFERLSPARWTAEWLQQRFLKLKNLPDRSDFSVALHGEVVLRPLRKRLVEVLEQVGEPFEHLEPLPATELAAAARHVSSLLGSAEALVARLEECEALDGAVAMARAATRGAVEAFLEEIRQGLVRHAARRTSFDSLDLLEPWMAAEWIASCRSAVQSNKPNEARIDPIGRELPHVAAYQKFRSRVPQLSEAVMQVFGELARLRDRLGALDDAELEATVRRVIASEARLAWKARLEASNPSLLMEAGELESKAASLSAADKEVRSLNRRLLVDGLDATKIKPLREWEDITRLRGVRAKRLREFVERGADLGLMRLRPVWLVNPDVASRLLPLRKAFFDMVIFDEASQMPVEYALPTLYRSGKMIVSGDEKQMPPTNFFSSRVESDEAEVYEGQASDADANEEEREAVEETWNRREIKDCPDLLQLARTVLPTTTLQIHYRSKYRELIQFSNASFYLNRLSVPARHPADEIRRQRPIEIVRVDGIYADQTNPAEAERVVDILYDLWIGTPGAAPTVGVVTFNRKQADLIDEVLEHRAQGDSAFRIALTRERDRIESGEDMGFFVKNVENVQGDERDVIVFSSTFGRNEQGTFRRSFGVLGQIGGERRLNVAVTRARQKVILVTSMPIPLISDLLATRRQATSPRDFLQAYFEYARSMSEGDLDAATSLLSRLTPEQRTVSLNGHHGRDGLEETVADEIRSLGWEPSTVTDDGAFALDFAIEDPRTGLYGIGIECDAPRHPILDTARAREMWRPSILRRSIPVIHRVSSHGWFHEPDKERSKLRSAIASAMGERV